MYHLRRRYRSSGRNASRRSPSARRPRSTLGPPTAIVEVAARKGFNVPGVEPHILTLFRGEGIADIRILDAVRYFPGRARWCRDAPVRDRRSLTTAFRQSSLHPRPERGLAPGLERYPRSDTDDRCSRLLSECFPRGEGAAWRPQFLTIVVRSTFSHPFVPSQSPKVWGRVRCLQVLPCHRDTQLAVIRP